MKGQLIATYPSAAAVAAPALAAEGPQATSGICCQIRLHVVYMLTG